MNVAEKGSQEWSLAQFVRENLFLEICNLLVPFESKHSSFSTFVLSGQSLLWLLCNLARGDRKVVVLEI